MCKWGTTETLLVPIVAQYSHTGELRWDRKPVDSCIAHIVKTLNDAGIHTVASCCGHGERAGSIALEDGRELIIAPNYKTSRRAERILKALQIIDGDEAQWARDKEAVNEEISQDPNDL